MKFLKHKRGQAGFTSLALVVMILLAFIGLSAMVYQLVSVNTKRAQALEDSKSALLLAQSRVEKAKAYIMSADPVLDDNSDGIINGLDSVTGNWVTLEDNANGKLMVFGNLRAFASDPKLQDHFIVRASGYYGGTYRAIEAKLGYLSFLKFARFAENSLSYGKGAVLRGMVYADGNIGIPTGSGGPHVIFKRDVITTGILTPKGISQDDGHHWEYVTVEGTLEENSTKNYTTNVSIQFNFYKASAQSSYGLYIDSTMDNKLANSQPQLSGSTGDNLIDLSLFKNLGTANAYYDANDNDSYDSASDIDLPDEFNGVVYWGGSNKVHIKGELTGQNLSIFSDNSIYVDASITTGSDANGYPVNIGLVSKYQLYWSYKIPSIFEVNAAIFCANSGYGVEDHDNSPYDNDNSHGWQSQTADPPFYFKVYGPLITKYGGDNGAWVTYGNSHAGVTTREWFYDVDITTFPPPFPIVEGVLLTLSYHEIEQKL